MLMTEWYTCMQNMTREMGIYLPEAQRHPFDDMARRAEVSIHALPTSSQASWVYSTGLSWTVHRHIEPGTVICTRLWSATATCGLH